MKKYRTVAIALMTSTVLSGCNPLGSIDDMATNVASEYLGQFQITEIEGKAIEANSKPQMSLNEDGSLTGNSGCNSFSGSYEWLGSVLRIGDMASTRKMCAPALMGQEQRLLGLFASVKSAKMAGLDLILTDENNNPLVKAARID